MNSFLLIFCNFFLSQIYDFYLDYNLGAERSWSIPFVLRRLKAPLSISECILFLLSLEGVLAFALVFPMQFFLTGSEPIFPLSTFVDPNDGDRWTGGTGCVDFVWFGFQLFWVFETCTFVLVGFVGGSWLAPRLRRALNASRNDWFCNITSGVEKFADSCDVLMGSFSSFREVEENVEWFWNVLREGDMLLLAKLKMNKRNNEYEG